MDTAITDQHLVVIRDPTHEQVTTILVISLKIEILFSTTTVRRVLCYYFVSDIIILLNDTINHMIIYTWTYILGLDVVSHLTAENVVARGKNAACCIVHTSTCLQISSASRLVRWLRRRCTSLLLCLDNNIY